MKFNLYFSRPGVLQDKTNNLYPIESSFNGNPKDEQLLESLLKERDVIMSHVTDLKGVEHSIANVAKNPCVFKSSNVLFADFDGETTIKEVVDKLGDIEYVIYVSKSHRIEKKGIVAERFHVLFPLKQLILDEDEYKRNLKKIIAHLDSDKACGNFNRKFFGPGDLPSYEFYHHKSETDILSILKEAASDIPRGEQSEGFPGSGICYDLKLLEQALDQLDPIDFVAYEKWLAFVVGAKAAYGPDAEGDIINFCARIPGYKNIKSINETRALFQSKQVDGKITAATFAHLLIENGADKIGRKMAKQYGEKIDEQMEELQNEGFEKEKTGEHSEHEKNEEKIERPLEESGKNEKGSKQEKKKKDGPGPGRPAGSGKISDLKLAEIFCQLFGDLFRWNQEKNSWYYWNGKFWEMDIDLKIDGYAVQISQRMMEAAKNKKQISEAESAGSRAKIRNMVEAGWSHVWVFG
jgi:hypothetical protein